MMHPERKSSDIERELEETRSELDETVRVLERKLSPEHLWAQTKSYFDQSVHSAGEMIRQHPIPSAIAGAVLLEEIVRRSHLLPSSRRRHRQMAFEQLLNDLTDRAARASSRARYSLEHSAPRASQFTDGATHALEDLVHRARRGVERGMEQGRHAVQSLSHNQSAAQLMPIAAALGAVVAIALAARRRAY